MIARLSYRVTAQDTAEAQGSGDLAVLATPRLLAWCEAATCAAAAEHLAAGRTSVGTRVQLDHLLASAVGAAVEVRAELVHQDGRLLEFEVTALDDALDDAVDDARDGTPSRLVGTGRVRRVVVDRDRFLARLARPAGDPPGPGTGPG